MVMLIRLLVEKNKTLGSEYNARQTWSCKEYWDVCRGVSKSVSLAVIIAGVVRFEISGLSKNFLC